MSRALVALVALVAAAAALGSAPVFAGPHVDVSVSVGQPGLYGRVDLGHGGYGPVVAYPQPVYLPAPAPVVVYRPYVVQAPVRAGYAQPHRYWQPHHHHHGGHANGYGNGYGNGNGNGNGRGHGRGHGGHDH